MGSTQLTLSASDVSPAVSEGITEGFARMRAELEQLTPAELGAVTRPELNYGIDVLGWLEAFAPEPADRKAIAERQAQLAILSYFCAAQRAA